MTLTPPAESPRRRAAPTTARLLLLQTLALLAVGAVTLLDAHILWNPARDHSGDVWLYYRTAARVLHGEMPYRDFPLEYPPLAILPFLLPRLVVAGHALGYTAYCRLLLAENALLGLAFARVLASTARRFFLPAYGGDAPDALPWAVAGVVLMSPFLPWRYDLFPALMTLLALRAAVDRRPWAAGVWLGLGVAAKLYPVVFLPVLAGSFWLQRDRRSCGRLVAGCLAAVAASVLPFAAAGPKILSFLQYHQHRGIEMESLAAGGVFLAHLLWRLPVLVVFNFGAYHLVSPLSPALLKIIPWAAAALLSLTLWWAWKRMRAEAARTGAVCPRTLVVALAAVLLAFVVSNKVFSPQYLIWFLPLAPLLPPRHRPPFGALVALTVALFPFAFPALMVGEPWAVGLLVLRNLLAVGLLARLLCSPPAILPTMES